MSVVPPVNDQYLYISPYAKVGVPMSNVCMSVNLEDSGQRPVQRHYALSILQISTEAYFNPERRSLCNYCEAAMAGELRCVTVVAGMAMKNRRPTLM